VAVERHSFLGPASYGAVIIDTPQECHRLTLVEVGKRAGKFEIELALEQVNKTDLDVEERLEIEGPFGSVEVSEILFYEENSNEIRVRLNKLRITSSKGETVIQVDLDAVGAFRVTRNLETVINSGDMA
jgi:hypothetical protein